MERIYASRDVIDGAVLSGSGQEQVLAVSWEPRQHRLVNVTEVVAAVVDVVAVVQDEQRDHKLIDQLRQKGLASGPVEAPHERAIRDN